MASDATLLEGKDYRSLLGRIFKVTECEADMECTAKVARLQEKFIKPAGMESKNETEGVMLNDTPDGDALNTSDVHGEGAASVSATGMLGAVTAQEGATDGQANILNAGPTHSEDMASGGVYDVKTSVEDASATHSEATAPVSATDVNPSISDATTAKDDGAQSLSATNPEARAILVESDGPCFSKSKKNDNEAYRKPLVTESNEVIPGSYNSKMPGKVYEAEPRSGEIDMSEGVRVSNQNENDDNHGYSSQETLDGETMEHIQNITSQSEDQDDSTEFGMGQISRFVSVSNRIDLMLYSQAEWKGDTERAEQIRQGYSKVMELTPLSAMRRIRGDNYCALRASCFQILSQNLNILHLWGENIQEIVNIPQILMQKFRCYWLKNWTFAGRLKVTPKKTAETMKQCLKVFCDEIIAARSFDNDDSGRVQHFMQYFNSGRQDEVLLFEAMKLLMLHSAVVFYDSRGKDEQVPLYAELLFARDTCNNPEELMKNHLNTVGGTGGLEQIEMFLLGHALNITIRVMRPSKVHEPDFVTFYPDDHISEWDTCNLIAEDDRHYNIIAP